jgi:cytochrome c1
LAIWLHDPPAVKPGSIMPNLHLSDQQISQLVAYLESLK